jgi:membrane fusion protein (multidrug efflux system)
MDTPRQPAGPFPPLVRWSAGLGLVVLAISLAAASLAMKPSEQGESAPPTHPAPGKRAVAVARVDVEGGVTKSLYPVRPGRVTAVPFREGEPIKEGQVLLRVDDTLARIDLARAENALTAAREKLAQARTLVKQHEMGLRAMEAAVGVEKKKVAAARAQAKKAARFFSEKLGGSQEDVDAAEALVAQAEAAVAAKEKDLERLRSMDPQGAVRLAESDILDKEEQLKAARLGIAECEVKAPYDGTLLRLGVAIGDVLGSNPKMPIMEYCRSGPRIVRAEVEQEFASLVRVGQTARMQDDATGGGEWKGKVLRIGDWFAKKRGQLLEPMEFNDVLTLEVVLAVEPSSQPLRIGQRLRVLLEGVP